MSKGYQNEQQRQELFNREKLCVRIIEARGLKAADWGGTSDPFVEVRIKNDPHMLKTKVIKKTLNPVWNEEFFLYPKSPDTDFLSLKIYDYDTVTNNDLIGELELPVAIWHNKKGPTTEEWKDVMDRKSGSNFKKGKGEIKVQVWFDGPQQHQGQQQQGQMFMGQQIGQQPTAYQQPQYPQYPPQQPQVPTVAQYAYPPQQPQYPQYPPQQPQYPQYPPTTTISTIPSTTTISSISATTTISSISSTFSLLPSSSISTFWRLLKDPELSKLTPL